MGFKTALLLMLLGTTSCLHFLDECMPKESAKAHLKGSGMKLRVWVPKIGDPRLLTLISENDLTGISRKIEIRKNVTTVQTKDDEKVSPEQELPIQNNSLPHGWVTFVVTSDENLTVTVPDANLTLIDVTDVVKDKNIKIKGIYVTVNCMLPANHWEVSAGQEVIIPLGLEGPHDFSLFSRVPFLPELAVGLGSLEPLGIPLLSLFFEMESKQMAAFSFYNFTLDCKINETKSSCYIQAGDCRVLVGSLPFEASSLSLKAGGTDDYIIVLGIGEDQKGERTGGQSEDTKGGGPYSHMMPEFSLSITVTFCVTVLLTCCCLAKDETKPEKGLSVKNQGGDRKKKGNEVVAVHATTQPLMKRIHKSSSYSITFDVNRKRIHKSACYSTTFNEFYKL